MNFLLNLWNWFNGKKTTIAAVLLTISAFLTEVVIGKWGADASWIPNLIDVLNWVGGSLGIVGLGHKSVKTSAGTN